VRKLYPINLWRKLAALSDKQGVFLLVLLILFSTLLTACSPDERNSANTTVVPTINYSSFHSVISVGAIFDLTGPNAAEGRDYYAGVKGYINYLNANGGVAGYKIDLKIVDFAGKAPVAIESYQAMVKEGVPAFIGWSHSDTAALTSQLADGKTPLFSASYREDYARDTKRNPYNFMIVPTYSDQIRMLVQFERINHPEPSRRLGVAELLVDNDFGRYSLQAGRNYAANNNIFWYHEGLLNPSIEVKNIAYEVNRLKGARPDWTLIQADPILAALTLRSIKKAAVDGRFVGMPTAGGPDFLALAGAAAEGYFVGVTLPYPTDESLGMAALLKWWTQHDRPKATQLETEPPKIPGDLYIQGWATAAVLLEGVRRATVSAISRGANPAHLSGDNIKNALETLENYDAQGLLPPLDYTANNHKGTRMKFYKVEGGSWKPFIPYSTLAEMEKMANIPKPTPIPPPTPTSVPKKR
jgi:branched-chain amino acid transport system substrate-binding protein